MFINRDGGVGALVRVYVDDHHESQAALYLAEFAMAVQQVHHFLVDKKVLV
jgi:hypothetical protein